MAFTVIGAGYALHGRVGAVEDKQEAHENQDAHTGAAKKEEVKELKDDIKNLDDKIDDMGVKQAVMKANIDHIKDAIDEIKRAVVRP